MYAALFSFGDWHLSELTQAHITGLQMVTLVLAWVVIAVNGARQFLASRSHEPGLTLASAFRKGAGKPSIAAIHRDLHIVRHWLDLTEALDGYNQLSVKGRILKLLRTHLG